MAAAGTTAAVDAVLAVSAAVTAGVMAAIVVTVVMVVNRWRIFLKSVQNANEMLLLMQYCPSMAAAIVLEATTKHLQKEHHRLSAMTAEAPEISMFAIVFAVVFAAVFYGKQQLQKLLLLTFSLIRIRADSNAWVQPVLISFQ